jgi:hypothetical protein
MISSGSSNLWRSPPLFVGVVRRGWVLVRTPDLVGDGWFVPALMVARDCFARAGTNHPADTGRWGRRRVVFPAVESGDMRDNLSQDGLCS